MVRTKGPSSSRKPSSLCPDLTTVIIHGLRIFSPILHHLPLLDGVHTLCWGLDAAQALQHPLRLIGDGIDGSGFIADLVQAGLHSLDETLAGLVGTVLVDAVVDVDQYVFDVVGFLIQTVWVDACDAGELEKVQQGGLGQPLEIEGALAIGVAWGVAVLSGLEGLDAGFFKGRELVF